nr:MAG: ORF1 [TTV-like mini virus]
MARYYYRRRWNPRYRRRYRPFWTRRTRAPFRRRRRRKYRVRRKLRTLPLKQWQPSHINKLCIKGLFCLFQMHKAKYNRNFNQWETRIPLEGLPNGGGFTIARFTLQALFEQHEKAHNVWTKSNKNFPLFRYTGCVIKVYRPLFTDLVIKFQTCYPMSSSKLMYTGSQPSIMMMTKGSKIIRCKTNAPNAKPYKKFRLPPPQQMTNKWYFQQDQHNTGLLLIQASAASLDEYYTSIHADSSTITLKSLNTKIFKNLNFANYPLAKGYSPNDKFHLWAANADNPQMKDLIWLGQGKLYNRGETLGQQNGTTFKAKYETYMSDPRKWGNVFHKDYLHQSVDLYFTQQAPAQMFAGHLEEWQETTKITEKGWTKVTQELFFTIRYNPFTDKGYNNNIYILPNWKDNENLEPDPDIDLQNPGFPNWLSCFGFVDYLLKLEKKSQLTTHYIIIHKSDYFSPTLPYYIFVDDFFLKGDSTDLEGRLDWDNINWYPMINHQEETLNTLALCGPGAPKPHDIKLNEAKIEYRFYFKVGGCAPPVEKVADPAKQPTFITPNNILDTNSLQSPEQPIESFLYQFDWRRDQITETAAKRITQDFSTSKYLFTDAKTTGTAVPLHKTQEKELLSSEEEETKTETLFEQLLQQRNKQKQLRHRIKLLMQQIQQLE